MALDELETRILEIIAERNLVRSDEMLRMLDGTDRKAIKAACASLLGREYIASLSPIGSACYAITQRGGRALSKKDFNQKKDSLL